MVEKKLTDDERAAAERGSGMTVGQINFGPRRVSPDEGVQIVLGSAAHNCPIKVKTCKKNALCSYCNAAAQAKLEQQIAVEKTKFVAEPCDGRCMRSGIPCDYCHDKLSPRLYQTLLKQRPAQPGPPTPVGWMCPTCRAVMAPTKESCVNCTGTVAVNVPFGVTEIPQRDKDALERFYKDDPDAAR